MNAPGSASTSARLAGLVAAGLGVCLPAIALACTCIVIPLETEIANTSHIFTAHKIGSHTAAPEYPDQHYEVLAVHAIWKGNVPAVVEVLIADSEASCGMTLLTDREYLVFAREFGPGGPLFTHVCSATASYPSGAVIWTLLGPPPVTPALPSSWGAIKGSYRR